MAIRVAEEILADPKYQIRICRTRSGRSSQSRDLLFAISGDAAKAKPAKKTMSAQASDKDHGSSARPAFWLAELTAPERSTLIATFGGWMLDGMDVMVYSFVIPTLIIQWHLTRGQAGLLGTVTLLLSAAGGWLAGIAADRYGRTRILQLTIFWFALFTFLSGFTNSYSQLLVTRGLQGLGFGGEWAVGSVLMGEAICPNIAAKR
jgi:hypothetical protein